MIDFLDAKSILEYLFKKSLLLTDIFGVNIGESWWRTNLSMTHSLAMH